MTVAVRPISAQDIDAVVLLAAGATEAPQWSREAYERALTPGNIVYFALLAADASAVCGFVIASWLPSEEAAELESVVVNRSYRRQGIGSALLRACMHAAGRAGARNMRLEVRESNAAALTLYQHNAFLSIGRRRAYYSGPVEDAILLQAPLGSPRSQSPL